MPRASWRSVLTRMAAKAARTCRASVTETETPSRTRLAEPLREVPGFEADMFDAPTPAPDGLGEGLRLARGARLLDDAAAFVDDADMRLVQRHLETCDDLHGLTSLIGRDVGEDPDVDDRRKARSAHLHRVPDRAGTDGDRPHMATFGVPVRSGKRPTPRSSR